MKINFDVISDLNLNSSDVFDWNGRSSSLYCLVAGNISDDISVIKDVLHNLSANYHCVFYIPGKLEFSDTTSVDGRLVELALICKMTNNLVLMYNHVCIVDGIAIVAAICEYGDLDSFDYGMNGLDFVYLRASMQRLQKHQDINKILVVTPVIPSVDLLCGIIPENNADFIDFTKILEEDTEKKTVMWIYGGSQDSSEQVFNKISYVSNPARISPYYPTRIAV